MTRLKPSVDEWRRLYRAAIPLKEMAPWEWMTEMDVFGVQNPETDELGFVSLMGRYGEHFALATYLGPFGLYSYWSFVELGEAAPAEMLLEIPHLQVMFQDRNVLTSRDRDQIKELGLEFRGRNAWPMFRSYRPGYLPWYMEAPEVRFLTYALEQALEVAPRFKEKPKMLEPGGDNDYLVRVPKTTRGDLVWQDQMINVSPPEPEPIRVAMDVSMLEAVMQLPRGEFALEMDLFMFPIRIEERGERPYSPYMLLMVDAYTGVVLYNQLLESASTREEVWGSIPLHVVKLLAQLGSIPRQIRVRSGLLYALLELLLEEFDFGLKRTPDLPSLDEAKEFLIQRFF